MSCLYGGVFIEQISVCSKYEWKDMNTEFPRRVRCLTKSVFQNNFDVTNNQSLFAVPTGQSPASGSLPVQGVFDCLLYLGEYYRDMTASRGRREQIALFYACLFHAFLF